MKSRPVSISVKSRVGQLPCLAGDFLSAALTGPGEASQGLLTPATYWHHLQGILEVTSACQVEAITSYQVMLEVTSACCQRCPCHKSLASWQPQADKPSESLWIYFIGFIMGLIIHRIACVQHVPVGYAYLNCFKPSNVSSYHDSLMLM